MANSEYHRYPWDGPEDDAIADSDDDLDDGPTATMVASNDRTNYVRVQNHALYIDEPEHLSHSFKKGGRGEAPSALGYLLTAAMGCQVNSLEQMLHKARLTEYEIDAECTGYTFLEDDVKRVQKIDLRITLSVPEAEESRANRCLEVYEKGCVVGETLKRGIDLKVAKRLVLDDDVAE
ncbi:OsmC family protein [Natronosalvus caseinilyticus]|uniref:OsmC family protein n=1 Tax=Natronosalvus caseinilyticus TaxID=2953747 RepID=UPI0028A9B8D2|nr:OsmC family protein [Natronosalvus caseinilyticus]